MISVIFEGNIAELFLVYCV